jgi:hypothetical protein
MLRCILAALAAMVPPHGLPDDAYARRGGGGALHRGGMHAHVSAVQEDIMAAVIASRDACTHHIR